MEAYRRYAPPLLRKAQRLLQNREDANDVVQGLFVDLLERGVEDTDLPYLYRAVTNRCLNLIRDRNTRAQLLQRQDAALRGVARVSCEARTVDLDLLSKLCDALDRDSCDLVVYRYLDDMSLEEIAALTGVSRKTLGKRLHRVREAVARLSEPPEVADE